MTDRRQREQGERDGSGGGGGRDYFEVIEEEFIRLRGAPLLLSPADWRLAERWRREGLPVDLVLESVREVFARRAERAAASPDAPKRRVSSLRYCRPAVEKAWAVHRDLGAVPPVRRRPSVIDVPAKLAALAAALPSSLQGVDAARRRLLALDGPAPEVEARLAELDLELAARAFDSLAPEDRETVLADAEAALRRTAGRVEERRLPDLRQRLVRRLVRERLGLPLLSLFAEPAQPPSGS